MANFCKQHPLTTAHISKIATLVDEKIGVTIAEAASEKKDVSAAARASLPDWYALLAIVMQMKAASGTSDENAETGVKPARVRLTKAQKEEAAKLALASKNENEPVIPADTGEPEGAE